MVLMTTEEILEKAKEKLLKEYEETVKYSTRTEIQQIIPLSEKVQEGVTRGWAIVMFAQDLGVKYDDIVEYYIVFKAAMEKLLTNKK